MSVRQKRRTRYLKLLLNTSKSCQPLIGGYEAIHLLSTTRLDTSRKGFQRNFPYKKVT
jgi:hypothetical protein